MLKLIGKIKLNDPLKLGVLIKTGARPDRIIISSSINNQVCDVKGTVHFVCLLEYIVRNMNSLLVVNVNKTNLDNVELMNIGSPLFHILD